MRYVISASFFFLMTIFAGCYGVSQNFRGTPPSPLPVVRKYVEEYGALSSPQLDEYFRSKIALLRSMIPPSNPVQYSVSILNTSQSIAFTPGGGYILLSKGLVRHLPRESELIFLLAHEISHEVLGHTKSENLFGQDAGIRQALELQADQYAVMLVAMAGYDPAAGLKALDDAHEGLLESQYSTVYPTLQTRRDALMKVLSTMPDEKYQAEDNEAFIRIKNSL